MSKKLSARRAAIIVTVAGMICAARAETTNSTAMPEMVITASRTGRDPAAEAATVYTMPAQDLVSGQGARTTPDMLDGIPSVMVQKTGYGQGSPYLRGFTGFRTLCMVDGIRLNNSVFRDGPNQYWNTVDPFSIRDYELVMGSGSVLYGSDAIGGTLNALTVDPPSFDGVPSFDTTLLLRGATADSSLAGRLQAAGCLSETFSFVCGYSVKSFGNLRGGEDVGLQEHTGYGEADFDLKAEFNLGAGSRLTVMHQDAAQDNAWRTHKTIYGTDWEGLEIGTDKVHVYDQDRDLSYVRYSAADAAPWLNGAEVTLWRQSQAESLERIKKDDKRESQGFDVETWGASLQLRSLSPLGKFVYGGDYYTDFVNSRAEKYNADGSLGSVEIQGPVADNSTYGTFDLFVEDTLTVKDSGTTIIPGIHYTRSEADAGRMKDPVTGRATGLEDSWDATVASLRAFHPLTPDGRHGLWAKVAQGFRAPNLSDLSRLDAARSNEIETPSPGLDPEEYVSFEAGIRNRFNRFVSQLCCYHTLTDGMIIRTPTGNTIDGMTEVTKMNAGAGYVQGMELDVRCLLTPHVTLRARGSTMNGRVDTYPSSTAGKESDYITRLMPPTAQVGARWESAGSGRWAELAADMAAKADRLSADDERDTQRIPLGGTPGYAVWTVRAGATAPGGLKLAAALENILDTDYRIHGSGVNEPGRNLLLTALYSF